MCCSAPRAFVRARRLRRGRRGRGADRRELETVDVSLVDFRLEPDSVHVDQAGTYTFRVTNDGQTHALEIEGSDLEEETETLDPVESDTITVELAEGDYELYCPVDGHKDQGMEGELVVGAVSRATVRDRQARSARALAKDGGLGPRPS